MVDRILLNEVRRLVTASGGPRLSFYLPTEKAGREIYKGSIELENLVRTATDRLVGHWHGPSGAREFLAPVLELVHNQGFWRETEAGLSIFLAGNEMATWRVATPFEPEVFVSDRFFVRPLLPAVGSETTCLVLAISRSGSRLYEANESEIKPLDVAQMPGDISSALNLVSTGRISQSHAGTRKFGGRQDSIFHGHGGKPDSEKDEIQQYFRLIDQAVTRQIANRTGPMLLACTTDDASRYRSVNTYPHLVDDVAVGSVERLNDSQMLKLVAPSIKPYLFAKRTSAIANYRDLIDTDRTRTETGDVLAAAHHGKIETLFVNRSAKLHGSFDPASQTINYQSSTGDYDRDLVEEAIAETLIHNGKVYSIRSDELPQVEVMAARLRFG